MADRYSRVRLRDFPARERPAARIADVGAASVNLAELLAAVIGGGRQLTAAQQLLARYGSLSALAQAPAAELTRIKGIGPSRAAALQAALALGVRIISERNERPRIARPEDAARLLFERSFAQEVEHFWVIPLNTRLNVLSVETLYKGSVEAVHVRVADVFREAIRWNAVAVLVAHNHPAGDPTPSSDDVRLTARLIEAGRQLGVDLLDHIVLGSSGRFVSIRETVGDDA